MPGLNPMQPDVLQLLRVFGRGLVESGILKPAERMAREGFEAGGAALRGLTGGAERGGALMRAAEREVPMMRGATAPRPQTDQYLGSPQRAQQPAASQPGLELRSDQGRFWGPGQAPQPTRGTGTSYTGRVIEGALPGPSARNILETPSIPGRDAPQRSLFTEPDPFTGERGIAFGVKPQRFAGGGMDQPPVPPGYGRGDLYVRGGDLVPSPGGSLGRESMLPVDVRDLGTAGQNFNPTDLGAVSSQINNAAGGLKQMDLSALSKLAPYFLGAGGVGLGAGLIARNMGGGGQEQPVETSMGPVTATPNTGPLNDPAVQSQQQAAAAAAASMQAGSGVNIAAPEYRGVDGRQTPTVTRGDNEELRSMKQQYASGSKTAASPMQRYFAEREAYGNANKTQIIDQLIGVGAINNNDLMRWAESNPALAYELLEKQLGNRKLPSQQTVQNTQAVIGTSLGNNNQNNAIGSAESAGQSAYNPTQGAADLRDALTPQMTEASYRVQLPPELINRAFSYR